MLKRLKHHINVEIERLLDQMILSTGILLILALILVILYASTHYSLWLGILWLSVLIYAITYFSDAIKYGKIVRDLDQDSLNKTIWLSKAYF